LVVLVVVVEAVMADLLDSASVYSDVQDLNPSQ